MAWTDTSDTCVTIFGTLGRLEQIDDHVNFDAAGSLTMNDLAFYDSLSTSDVNNANAAALARLIDQMIVNGFAATYKAGFNSPKAVATIAGVLQVDTKTIEDLSDTADTIYSV